jgi:transcriptional regulator with XRE-family HTH domain
LNNKIPKLYFEGFYFNLGGSHMITAAQMRAARALLGMDQRQLADAAGVSLPTIQRMEGSDGQVRGNVDSLVKVVEALERSGVELINEGVVSAGGGRGVRLKEKSQSDMGGD